MPIPASPQLTAMNFVDYNIRTEFASDKRRKLTIIACPLKGSFKYEVVNGAAFVYLGSSLEEAVSEYNQV